MPADERDWMREPPAAGRDRTRKAENPVEGPEAWELTMTGDGYRMERAPEKPRLGWADVAFWLVILIVARYLGD